MIIDTNVPNRNIRPIKFGGTGADNPEEALANLGIKDYVVEYATYIDDIGNQWAVCKWYSGLCEAWSYIEGNCTVAVAVGNGYRSEQKSYAYPSNLFIEKPHMAIGQLEHTYAMVNMSVYTVGADKVVFYLNSAQQVSAAQAYKASFYVKGKWK